MIRDPSIAILDDVGQFLVNANQTKLTMVVDQTGEYTATDSKG